MKKKKSKGVTKRLPFADPGLVRLLDDALVLLADRAPSTLVAPDAPPIPLPSLLDRCRDMLAASRLQPARFIHTFGLALFHDCSNLLDPVPNLKLVDADFTGFRDLGPSLSALADGTRAAALTALQDGLDAAGTTLVLWHDQIARYSNLQKPEPDPVVRAFHLREQRGVVLVRHPLVSYLQAHQSGKLPFRPASLEVYAERYLAFLSDHDAVPVILSERIASHPSETLRLLCQALDLPQNLSVLVKDGPDGFDARREQSPHTLDGKAATEEPLDSPAYCRLCLQLGYQPDVLPDMAPDVTAPQNGPPIRPLPARNTNRPPSRIAAFAPLLARAIDSHQTMPGQLDVGGIVGIIEDCLGHPSGFYEALDTHLRHLPPREAALVLIGGAADYAARGETVHTLALLADAGDYITPDDSALRLLTAELYLRLRKPELALPVLTAHAMAGANRLEPAQQALLTETLAKFYPTTSGEHGHALLLEALNKTPPANLDRRRVMIEIGTTRERVPGQGSTEKLARLCEKLGMDFVTVDMDPHNTLLAKRMFHRLNMPFRAVAAKGEDFLASWTGPIDYCFLDAYDFDHGKHTELRQSRYETYLGSRIDDAQCHQMHLDCATSLALKLSPDGLICFDDTWTDENGAWTAKGLTAMPYLLDQGFKVTVAANRAALLRRGQDN